MKPDLPWTMLEVAAEDEALLAIGYSFVGYHGCNQQDLQSIIKMGLDERFSGINAGSDRGAGFYVARERQNADSFAEGRGAVLPPEPPVDLKDRATMADYMSELKKREVNPQNYLLGGGPVTARVYAKDFLALEEGLHYSWGKMGRFYTGFPGNCELTFRFQVYHRLKLIPALDPYSERTLSRMISPRPSEIHEHVQKFDYSKASTRPRRNSDSSMPRPIR